MGIEDPVWGRIVIVLGFIGILLGFLYFSKLKGKKIFSQLSSNEFLKLDETISISNISKANLKEIKKKAAVNNPEIIFPIPKNLDKCIINMYVNK